MRTTCLLAAKSWFQKKLRAQYLMVASVDSFVVLILKTTPTWSLHACKYGNLHYPNRMLNLSDNSNHLGLAFPLHHFTNHPRLLPLLASEFHRLANFFSGYDDRHADAHVEHLIEFFFRHATFGLDDLEN